MNDDQGTELVAWGDESVLVAASPSLYLLAATVFDADELAAARALESARPAGAKKLHWRNMTDKQKACSIQVISDIGHQTTIVAASPLRRVKQERARRKCLESLLVKLEEAGVAKLCLESRQEIQDRRDIDCLIYARRANIVSGIDIAHVRGETDPRLWLPDQVLGAYGEKLCRPEKVPRWADSWAKVMEHIEVLDIEL